MDRIPNGTTVTWKGVNRTEKGKVIGFYLDYIVELESGKCVLINSGKIKVKTDDIRNA